MVIRLLRAKLWSAPCCRTKIPDRLSALAHNDLSSTLAQPKHSSVQVYLNPNLPKPKASQNQDYPNPRRLGWSVAEICSISSERRPRLRRRANELSDCVSICFHDLIPQPAHAPRLLDAILVREAQAFIDLGADRVGVEMHRIEPPCQDGGERCLSRSGQPPSPRACAGVVSLYLIGDNSWGGFRSGKNP